MAVSSACEPLTFAAEEFIVLFFSAILTSKSSLRLEQSV